MIQVLIPSACAPVKVLRYVRRSTRKSKPTLIETEDTDPTSCSIYHHSMPACTIVLSRRQDSLERSWSISNILTKGIYPKSRDTWRHRGIIPLSHFIASPPSFFFSSSTSSPNSHRIMYVHSCLTAVYCSCSINCLSTRLLWMTCSGKARMLTSFLVSIHDESQVEKEESSSS